VRDGEIKGRVVDYLLEVVVGERGSGKGRERIHQVEREGMHQVEMGGTCKVEREGTYKVEKDGRHKEEQLETK
jgi:hypothetical protein